MPEVNGHKLIMFNMRPDKEPAQQTLGPQGAAECKNCDAKGNDISLTQCPAAEKDYGLLTASRVLRMYGVPSEHFVSPPKTSG
jgi:hypothetical protein